MAQAMSQYLQQRISSKEPDTFDQAFETAVLMFIRAEYRECIDKFQQARLLAQQEGRADVAGDVLRWLGHAHGKLSNVAEAERFFQQGAQEAEQLSNSKLRVGGRAAGWWCEVCRVLCCAVRACWLCSISCASRQVTLC
jgi:hypothetical protein